MKMEQTPLSPRWQALYIGVTYQTRLEITMTTRRAVAFRSSLIGSGSIFLGATTPALAALPALPVFLSPPDVILGGLLVVLVTALVMRLTHRHDDISDVSAPTGADMRWWKHPQM